MGRDLVSPSGFLFPESPRVISPLFGSVLGPLLISHLRFQTCSLRNGLPFNFGKARPAQGHLESPGLFLFAHLTFWHNEAYLLELAQVQMMPFSTMRLDSGSAVGITSLTFWAQRVLRQRICVCLVFAPQGGSESTHHSLVSVACSAGFHQIVHASQWCKNAESLYFLHSFLRPMFLQIKVRPSSLLRSRKWSCT
jgi:hypothetical protein